MNMENVSEKAIGYSLLFSGLVIIIFTAFSIFQIFTGNRQPIQLFDFPGIDFSVLEMPETELVSPELLNDTSNFLGHIFIMGFLANIGSKISMIGVYLLRPIKVNLKKDNDSSKKISEK